MYLYTETCLEWGQYVHEDITYSIGGHPSSFANGVMGALPHAIAEILVAWEGNVIVISKTLRHLFYFGMYWTILRYHVYITIWNFINFFIHF
jgi:hypothetical protein